MFICQVCNERKRRAHAPAPGICRECHPTSKQCSHCGKWFSCPDQKKRKYDKWLCGGYGNCEEEEAEL
jgi:hypothetical protein